VRDQATAGWLAIIADDTSPTNSTMWWNRAVKLSPAHPSCLSSRRSNPGRARHALRNLDAATC
jgi:hypothetical protein